MKVTWLMDVPDGEDVDAVEERLRREVDGWLLLVSLARPAEPVPEVTVQRSRYVAFEPTDDLVCGVGVRAVHGTAVQAFVEVPL